MAFSEVLVAGVLGVGVVTLTRGGAACRANVAVAELVDAGVCSSTIESAEELETGSRFHIRARPRLPRYILVLGY